MQIRIRVNGRARAVNAEPGASLLQVLRDELDLTGAKYGCGEGQCGTCTVLVGGEAVRACVFPVGEVKDKPVVTIEGLARGGRLNRVQAALLEASAFQCGFCTPGMILEAVALLERRSAPEEAEIRSAMEGHICRCGTYPRIVEAVRMAARSRR
jgi:aerobic-type carbon monoxide dehydrogenase small subunit (CoxS/CutS family)